MGGILDVIFGGDTPTPEPIPVPEPPKAVPMVDEDAILKKKKKQIAAQQQRGGRTATILSDLGESDTLG